MSAETQDIAALPAGRALDALIDERVFGLARCDLPMSADSRLTCSLSGTLHLSSDGERSDRAERHYSTDIAAAWQVVEKLQGFDTDREHPWWSVALFYAQPGQVGCRVYSCPPGYSIFADDSDAIISESIAATAPLAICRAALAAVEARA